MARKAGGTWGRLRRRTSPFGGRLPLRGGELIGAKGELGPQLAGAGIDRTPCCPWLAVCGYGPRITRASLVARADHHCRRTGLDEGASHPPNQVTQTVPRRRRRATGRPDE